MAFDLEEWNIPRDNLLRSCFLIAAFELLRSLYFSFSSVSVMISHTNSYSILAYLSTIAWILTVVGLFVGLWKGRPTLLVFWLLFSGFATAMDIIYLIWNVTSSPVFDVDHFKHWTILYFGIFYECTGLYLVFRYFRRLYSYCLLEGGNYDWFSKDETQKTVKKMMQLKQYLQLQMQRLLKRQMSDNIKKHLKEQTILVILNMFKEIKFLFRAIF